MKFFRLFALLSSFLLSFFIESAFAQQAVLPALTAPDVLVKTVTDDVLNTVRKDQEIQKGDAQKINALVQEKVLPYFNFNRMTALAVGKDWNKATAAQKKQLIEQFQELLVRTYSNALSSYRDQTVRYKPLSMKPDDTEVLVRTEMIMPNSRPVQLDYSLSLANDGDSAQKRWKVYDVIVGGVSLVTNYRDTFSKEVREGGIDGLLHSLVSKNKELEEKDRKKTGQGAKS